MKRTRDYNKKFYIGIIFVGTGVVFLTSVNKALGAAFIGIGGICMILGGKIIKEKNEIQST